jgi:hypothetical protein
MRLSKIHIDDLGVPYWVRSPRTLPAMSGIRSDDVRQRGRIEERGKTLRVIVYAGVNPVTGKRVYLRETINGTDAAAYKRAHRALNKLLGWEGAYLPR